MTDESIDRSVPSNNTVLAIFASVVQSVLSIYVVDFEKVLTSSISRHIGGVWRDILYMQKQIQQE